MTGSGNYELSDKIRSHVLARLESTFYLPSFRGSKNSKYFSILPLDLSLATQFVGVLHRFIDRCKLGGGGQLPSSIFCTYEFFLAT